MNSPADPRPDSDPRPSDAFRDAMRERFVREAERLRGTPARRLASRALWIRIAAAAAIAVGLGLLARGAFAPRAPVAGRGTGDANAGPAGVASAPAPGTPSVAPAPAAATAPAAEGAPSPRLASAGPVERSTPDARLIAERSARWDWTEPRRIRLDSGRIYLDVEPTGEPFVVERKGDEVVVTGTRLVVSATPEVLSVGLGAGAASVSTAAGTVELAPGEEATARAGEAPTKADGRRFSHLIAFASDALEAAEAGDGGGRGRRRSEGFSPGLARIPGQERPATALEVVRYHVDVHIEDGMARTTIDQTFFNPNGSRVEGTFLFPLPPDASISRLAMYVDGNLMEGGMAERGRAVEVYEGIVRRMKDPALLEWLEGSTFRLRIFPFDPWTERRIVLSYQQSLESLYDVDRYRFPIARPAEPWGTFSVRVLVKGAGTDGWKVECATYPLEQVARAAGDLELAHEEANARPAKDLLIEVRRPPRPKVDLASHLAGDERFACVTLAPEVAGKVYRGPRRVLLIADRSGKAAESEKAAQRLAAARVLRALDRKDEIAVLAYSTDARTPGAGFVPRTKENLAAALAFLDGERFVGAGDVGLALRRARDLFGTPRDGDTIVYVGDGIDTIGGLETERLVETLPAAVRFLALPVSRSWDRRLLGALADRSGGRVLALSPDDRIGWRVLDLVSSLRTPEWSEIPFRLLDADGKPVKGTFHADRSNLRAGEVLRIAGRIEGSWPASLSVCGETIPLPERRPDVAWIPRLWAKLRIDALERDSAAEHREEIVSLGKAYYVMSPFTALLVLENEAMYAEHGIDRGRKDHWALYPAPESWRGQSRRPQVASALPWWGSDPAVSTLGSPVAIRIRDGERAWDLNPLFSHSPAGQDTARAAAASLRSPWLFSLALPDIDGPGTPLSPGYEYVDPVFLFGGTYPGDSARARAPTISAGPVAAPANPRMAPAAASVPASAPRGTPTTESAAPGAAAVPRATSLSPTVAANPGAAVRDSVATGPRVFTANVPVPGEDGVLSRPDDRVLRIDRDGRAFRVTAAGREPIDPSAEIFLPPEISDGPAWDAGLGPERVGMRLDVDSVRRALHEARRAGPEIQERSDTLEHYVAAYEQQYGPTGPPVPGIDAVVKAVDTKAGFVVLSAGEEHGIRPGHELTVSRGARWIGKVRVVRVYPDLAGARIDFTKEGEEVRVGDSASTRISGVPAEVMRGDSSPPPPTAAGEAPPRPEGPASGGNPEPAASSSPSARAVALDALVLAALLPGGASLTLTVQGGPSIVLLDSGERMVVDGDAVLGLAGREAWLSEGLFEEPVPVLAVLDPSVARVPWFLLPAELLAAGAAVSVRPARPAAGAAGGTTVVTIDRGGLILTELELDGRKPLAVRTVIRGGGAIRRTVYEAWRRVAGIDLPTRGSTYGPASEALASFEYSYGDVSPADLERLRPLVRRSRGEASLPARALASAVSLYLANQRPLLEGLLRKAEADGSVTADLRKVARLSALRFGIRPVIEAPDLDSAAPAVRRWLERARPAGPPARDLEAAFRSGDLAGLAARVAGASDVRKAIAELDGLRAGAPSGLGELIDLWIGDLAGRIGWSLKAYEALSRARGWSLVERSVPLLDRLADLALDLSQPEAALEFASQALEAARASGQGAAALAPRLEKLSKVAERKPELFASRGIQVLEEWADVSPEDPRPHGLLVDLHQKAGRRDLAVRHASQRVELAPSKQGYTELAAVLDRLGEKGRAGTCRKIAKAIREGGADR